MKLPEEQILWVAKLAQIELTETDKNRFADDLSNIISFVDELAAVNVSELPEGAADNSQITGLSNVAGADVVGKCEIAREEFLNRAPQSSGPQIKVKKVLDNKG